MEYKITGTVVPSVEISLNKGESIYTQRGGMYYMTDGMSLKTEAKGGFMKGLGRVLSGESLFLSTYSADKDCQKIAFASTVPGSIMPLDVAKSNYTIQKGAFLAAESSVQLETTFTRKLSVGAFGGDGFILQTLKGNGMAFLEVDGDAVVLDLKDGETIKVDTGNLVAFEEGVCYDIETVKGVTNVLFSGEGLFLTKLTGPGRVILQSMSFSEFALRVSAYIPSKG